MSKRTLIKEMTAAYQFGLPDPDSREVTTLVNAPTLRPRIEGQREPLRGELAGAYLADRATVTFIVRPAESRSLGTGLYYPTISQLFGYLVIEQFSVEGPTSRPIYPYPERDVSGAMVAARGVISVDVGSVGACIVGLRMGFSLPAESLDLRVAPVLVTIQIHGNVRPLECAAESHQMREA